MYHCIKEFSQYNLQLNMAAQTDAVSRTVWPLIAIMSDSVVMFKKFDQDSTRYQV